MNKVIVNEIARIKDAYHRRDVSGKNKLVSSMNPANLYTKQQMEISIISLLKANKLDDLSEKVILDVGCGDGATLREFIKYGAQPSNCYGIDLLKDRIDTAKLLSPNVNYVCDNAEILPYEDEAFDIALLFTVFTSILKREMKQNLATEVLRVVKRKGFIIFFDFHMDNPANPDVAGVKKEEILYLFPDCDISLRRLTLALPLARKIAPHSFMLCQILEKLPMLRTHYLCSINKR